MRRHREDRSREAPESPARRFARRSQTDDSSPLDYDEATFLAGEQAGVLKRFARRGIRYILTEGGGSGTVDSLFVRDDAEIAVVNCVLPRMRRRTFEVDHNFIMLRAQLSCDVVFRVDGHPPMEFNRPELTLACVPAGLQLVTEIRPRARQQGIVALLRSDKFLDTYGLRAEDLPAVLRDAVGGRPSAGRLVSLPLQPTVASLVADTIESQLDGEARALQFQGRLAELVAYTLDAIAGPDAAPLSPRRAQLRPRDADLAQLALARLARDYRRPPLFDDLARELGTNPNKLRTAFKDAYGITMAEYCLQRRLRESQQLLLEAKLTIAQIAERVGYEHQSAFTAAFSSHLGMTPRQYRQHRAPVNLALRPDMVPVR